jgi:hypothetical protein
MSLAAGSPQSPSNRLENVGLKLPFRRTLSTFHLFVPIQTGEMQKVEGLSLSRVSSVTSSGALEATLGLVLRELNGRGLDCGLIASKQLKILVSII